MASRPEASPFFSLIPAHPAALRCLENPQNAGFVYTPTGTDRPAFKVSLQNMSKIDGCIISFGRGWGADIRISGTRTSQKQCIFILHETTGEIIFRDCSYYGSSTLINQANDGANPLGGDPGQVVVRPKDDVIIGMGGLHGDLLKFEIAWPPTKDEVIKE